MINPAPILGAIFGPLGAHGGPGSLGTGPKPAQDIPESTARGLEATHCRYRHFAGIFTDEATFGNTSPCKGAAEEEDQADGIPHFAIVRSWSTLCYVIVLPGSKSKLRAGFRPDSNRESLKIGPPAGRRADFGVFPVAVRPKSDPEDRFPARKHYCVT